MPEPDGNNRNTGDRELFERMPVPKALLKMAIPTIISQLVTLVYNIADTWFIGRTNDPYKIAAASLVLTVFLMTIAIANLFGVGGGSLAVRLMGGGEEDEARRVASWSLVMGGISSLGFSVVCLAAMDPLLRLLGASSDTIGYARQYLLFVVVIGGVPTVLSNIMATMLRNVGYSRQAGFGLSMGGILNIALDPLLMFVLLPDGYQVMGAGIATMASNVVVFVYFLFIYRRVRGRTALELPRRVERIRKNSLGSIFEVGIPAALSLFLFDLTNIVINKLSSAHGDVELAAIGIVQKVERLPLNIGVGICLAMVPLVAYNYASGDHKRMRAFFSTARIAGLAVSAVCVVLYRIFAPQIVEIFISDADTVRFGQEFLAARCCATPFMFLSFHMVHYMQAIGRGRVSFWLAAIRQLALNIPILFLFNRLFGMTGIVWTQLTADVLNVILSYVIYFRLPAPAGRRRLSR